ncbi:longifolia 1-like protein [Tanacetum coccineum]
MNESRRSIPMEQVQGGAENETSHEPGSNKRPSPGVVARLMGLESLTDSSSEVKTSKIMPPLNDHPSSRLSRNGEEYKQNHGSVSPRVYLKIKPASQQQEDNDELTKKLLFMILETMQTTRRVLENKELDSQKCDQSGSPTVKKTISPKRREPINQATRPTKMATETKMMAGITMLTIWLKSRLLSLFMSSEYADNTKLFGTSIFANSPMITGLTICSSEDGVNNMGSESVTNEVEMAGVSEVSLDNLENMELIDTENMPNDLLALSVSELDEEEYVDQPLSIVSSPEDDPSFEDLNPSKEFGSPSFTPDYLCLPSKSHMWPICEDLDADDVVPVDAGSPLPEEKQHSTLATTNADSNSMNSDDNSVASADVSIVQEQSSFCHFSKLSGKTMSSNEIQSYQMTGTSSLVDKSYKHEDGFVIADIYIGVDIQLYAVIANWMGLLWILDKFDDWYLILNMSSKRPVACREKTYGLLQLLDFRAYGLLPFFAECHDYGVPDFLHQEKVFNEAELLDGASSCFLFLWLVEKSSEREIAGIFKTPSWVSLFPQARELKRLYPPAQVGDIIPLSANDYPFWSWSRSASEQLKGKVGYRHSYIDFSDLSVRFSNVNESVRMCPAAMGFAFAAGTTDGPGAFDFTQGDDQGNAFWKLVGGLLKKTDEKQIKCQDPKPIVIDSGEMHEPYDWVVRGSTPPKLHLTTVLAAEACKRSYFKRYQQANLDHGTQQVNSRSEVGLTEQTQKNEILGFEKLVPSYSDYKFQIPVLAMYTLGYLEFSIMKGPDNVPNRWVVGETCL